MFPRMRRRLPNFLYGMSLFLSLGLFQAGCSATFPAIIDPSEIASLREGRPRISRVRDLGAVHIGQAGPLAGESDGVFAIGELVLIEGGGFGRQPTVSIGGRPAELRWRTEGGGIVVQVPAGSDIGQTNVTVQVGGDRASAPLPLYRLALVLDARRGELLPLRIGRSTDGTPTVESAGPTLAVPRGRSLAVSHDGAAAYVLCSGEAAGKSDSVAIIDLVAPGGPRLTDTRQLRHRAHQLAAAERAGVLAILGGDAVTIWDIREARRPATWPSAELPEGIGKARTAALHPDGALLALGIAEDNQVVLVDVKPGFTEVKPREVARAAALPGLRQPLLHSLRFSADGATLWVSSGDNKDSIASGHQPTRVTALQLNDDHSLTVQKSLDLRDAGGPVQLALARTPPASSGASIRTPPEKATVFLTTTAAPPTESAKASLWRSDLTGRITPLYAGKESLAGLDVSPDARLVVTERISPGQSGRTLAVTDVETNKLTALPLGPADEADLADALHQLKIALQP
jgi:hypothetical protein